MSKQAYRNKTKKFSFTSRILVCEASFSAFLTQKIALKKSAKKLKKKNRVNIFEKYNEMVQKSAENSTRVLC